MVNNDYVIMIQEGDKVYGRLLDEQGGNNGFIVFPHKDIINPGPGLFKIEDLQTVYTNKDTNTKFGFVKGHYIIPDRIDVKTLTQSQKHQLLSRGIIKYEGNFGDDNFIALKVDLPGDNIYYLAFMIEGRFEFLNKLSYLNEYTLFNSKLCHINKSILSEMFITKNRMLSLKGMCYKPIRDSKLLSKNKDKYVLRELFNDKRYKDLHIALYVCSHDKEFDVEVYDAIKEYNLKIANTILTDLEKIESVEFDVDKVYNILRFYNLHSCI